jgi:hypothetical protein
MSGTTVRPAKAGPSLATAAEELCAAFPSDAAFQDAIARLQQAGFDRADISAPAAVPTAATPEASAENPNAEDDIRQSRTLHTSMAASVGAVAAAGAVIATGGAALPAVAAAIAGGVGLGAAMQGLTGAADKAQHDLREEAAARGELLLTVRMPTPSRLPAAEAAMRAAGAKRVFRVRLEADQTAATV